MGRISHAAFLVLLGWGAAAPGLAGQCPDGSPAPCRLARAVAAPAANSVAVLYLDNLSPDSADAFLADGLTEEIASRLGDVARLSVKQASREGIRRIRETTPDYRVAAGRAFNVRYLVEGSLRRGGTRVRVEVRLINSASGFRVWGQTYDRATSDLLDLQEEIAGEVAASIAGQLAPADRTALSRRPTANPVAYEHYLRGNYYLAQRSVGGLVRAIREFETAGRLDPGFSRATARAALTYLLAYSNLAGPDFRGFFGLPPDSLLTRGVDLTAKVLSRDSTISDGWVAEAYAASFLHPRSFEGVLSGVQRAVALDPHNAEALHQYAFFLREVGQDSAARIAGQRSLAIEPERAITLSAMGLLSFLARDYHDSERWLDSSLSVDPDFSLSYIRRSRTRLMIGDLEGARADAEQALHTGGPDSSLGEALLVLVSARSGDAHASKDYLRHVFPGAADTIEAIQNEDRLLPVAALVALGERERSLTVLEQVRPRGARFWSALRAPDLDPLREDPRFQRLVQESRPP